MHRNRFERGCRVTTRSSNTPAFKVSFSSTQVPEKQIQWPPRDRLGWEAKPLKAAQDWNGPHACTKITQSATQLRCFPVRAWRHNLNPWIRQLLLPNLHLKKTNGRSTGKEVPSMTANWRAEKVIHNLSLPKHFVRLMPQPGECTQ